MTHLKFLVLDEADDLQKKDDRKALGLFWACEFNPALLLIQVILPSSVLVTGECMISRAPQSVVWIGGGF